MYISDQYIKNNQIYVLFEMTSFCFLLKQLDFWYIISTITLHCLSHWLRYYGFFYDVNRVQHKLYKQPDTGHTNISLYVLNGLEIHHVGICDVANNPFLFWKHGHIYHIEHLFEHDLQIESILKMTCLNISFSRQFNLTLIGISYERKKNAHL